MCVMSILRVAFVGSRVFQMPFMVKDIMKKVGPCIVISGGARGVDKEAEKAADELGYGKRIILADWVKYGKSAGPKRNYEMVCQSDAAIAFWDGKSRGTRDFIKKAMIRRIPMAVYEYVGPPKKITITRYNLGEKGVIGQLELQ